MEGNIILAFSLTLLAGLSTGLGGALALVLDRKNTKILSVGLGFSAGVMIYVSFMELMPQAQHTLVNHLGDAGKWTAIAGFFGGIALSMLLDKLVPDKLSYHELDAKSTCQTGTSSNSLSRMGYFTAFAIALHNFPEGLATFIGTMEDPKLGVSLAIAIAIHNIPEGMAIALPLCHALGNSTKAFGYALLSGLAEPIGAVAGYLLLRTFISDELMAITFSVVAGIMVYISLDELLPMARESGNGHTEMLGLVIGMLVMAISLLLF
ncbi:zinc transporter ZupT [Dendrosporobacter sp. 1207_IL3150]|uniref:zinc transporter ZupT n=1 Tax=Dendrosporobacter sp. 1207_IL3150 TaxID=3084054 RepID=UPI002FDA11F0